MSVRPLSEITAEAMKCLYAAADMAQSHGMPRSAIKFRAAYEGLAELSGRLDGAVVLTRREAVEVSALLTHYANEDWDGCAPNCPGCHYEAALLCGRPGKETE